MEPLERINFESEIYRRNPYLFYQSLIDENPAFYSKLHRQHFVYSYQGVREVLTNKSFTVDSPFRASRTLFGRTVMDVDGEEHKKLRLYLSDAFTIKQIQKYKDLLIRPTIEEVVSTLEPNICLDWVSNVCDVIPIRVMSHVIGIPVKHFRFFQKCSKPIIEYLDVASPENLKRARKAINELNNFLNNLLSEPESIAKRSVIGQMLKYNGKIGNQDIIRQATLLIPAAIDTTNRLLANCIFLLIKNQNIQTQLLNNQNLIENFVLEVMRFEPPIHSTVRIATQSIKIEGLQIPRGGIINVNLASANRDPSQFSAPEKFDIERSNVGSALGFGAGQHQCLGRLLALSEVSEFIQVVLTRFAPLAFCPDCPDPYIFGLAFRSPTQLPIIFEE